MTMKYSVVKKIVTCHGYDDVDDDDDNNDDNDDHHHHHHHRDNDYGMNCQCNMSCDCDQTINQINLSINQ